MNIDQEALKYCQIQRKLTEDRGRVAEARAWKEIEDLLGRYILEKVIQEVEKKKKLPGTGEPGGQRRNIYEQFLTWATLSETTRSRRVNKRAVKRFREAEEIMAKVWEREQEIRETYRHQAECIENEGWFVFLYVPGPLRIAVDGPFGEQARAEKEAEMRARKLAQAMYIYETR